MKSDHIEKKLLDGEGSDLIGLQELRDLVESGQVSAVTVDTCAFDDNGMRLDRGLFSQLRQFGRHPARFIISEVVLSEIRSHLTSRFVASKKRFGRDMLDACEFVGGDVAEVMSLKDKLDRLPPIEALCEEQINSFCQESKAEILQADEYVKVSDVLELYFQRMPPFQAENPKKSEFPDAIALASLENWACANNTQVIVVSRDGDWKSFCEGSGRLHQIKNLSDALSIFQTPDEIVSSMLNYLRAGLSYPDSALLDVLRDAIKEYEWEPHIESDSFLEYESEALVEITDVYFNDESVDAIKMTERDDDTVSVAFNLQVDGQLNVYYTFQKWDGIDKEYVDMGSNCLVDHFSSAVFVALTMPVRNGEPYEFEVSIQPEPLHFKFGEVEPSWMSGGD